VSHSVEEAATYLGNSRAHVERCANPGHNSSDQADAFAVEALDRERHRVQQMCFESQGEEDEQEKKQHAEREQASLGPTTA
jgi:hypothetical protein